MKNPPNIDKYLEFVENNYKRLVISFDDLYEELAEHGEYKTKKNRKQQLKELNKQRAEAFFIYRLTIKKFFEQNNIVKELSDERENWFQRTIRKIFHLKSSNIMIIEDSMKQIELSKETIASADIKEEEIK